MCVSSSLIFILIKKKKKKEFITWLAHTETRLARTWAVLALPFDPAPWWLTPLFHVQVLLLEWEETQSVPAVRNRHFAECWKQTPKPITLFLSVPGCSPLPLPRLLPCSLLTGLQKSCPSTAEQWDSTRPGSGVTQPPALGLPARALSALPSFSCSSSALLHQWLRLLNGRRVLLQIPGD